MVTELTSDLLRCLFTGFGCAPGRCRLARAGYGTYIRTRAARNLLPGLGFSLFTGRGLTGGTATPYPMPPSRR